jgi:excisionase family DNA binding protein
MADGLSATEAARRLDTSRPTIYGLLEGGELKGVKLARGTRFAWRVDEASVEEYLVQHGKFAGTRRASRPRMRNIERDIAGLRELVLAGAPVGGLEQIQRERDDLRASVVTLTEAVARSRTVADLQAQADTERAAMIQHLLAAASAGERADALRRAAAAELKEAVATASRAGHLGALRAQSETR